jgi:hypothetical protein
MYLTQLSVSFKGRSDRLRVNIKTALKLGLLIETKIGL